MDYLFDGGDEKIEKWVCKYEKTTQNWAGVWEFVGDGVAMARLPSGGCK